jgi:hypothetical protein
MESDAPAANAIQESVGLDCRIMVPGLAAILEEAPESERIL